MEVARERTPIGVDALRGAIRSLRPDMGAAELAAAIAVSQVETADGQSAWNWNAGNVSASLGSASPYWVAPWHDDPDDPRSDPTRAPQAFRAYPDLRAGVADMLDHLDKAPGFFTLARAGQERDAFNAYVRGYVHAEGASEASLRYWVRYFRAELSRLGVAVLDLRPHGGAALLFAAGVGLGIGSAVAFRRGRADWGFALAGAGALSTAIGMFRT